MRFAVSCPNVGDPARLVSLAVTAEAAGWDGFLLWDHLHLVRGAALELHDPWVLLGAVAHATSTIRLGALVTPLARRRPWKLAKEITTLDHLSAGRVVVGVGLGWPADDDFAAFGDPADDRQRAAVYDEALEVLDALLRDGHVRHDGDAFHVDADFHPAPVQRPRPPIWVAAMSGRKPLARAAHYDGLAPVSPIGGPMSPTDVAAVIAALPPHAEPYDVVVPWDDSFPVDAYAAVGTTWLTESRWPAGDWLDDLSARVARGPTR